MTVRQRRIVGLGEVIFRDVAAGAQPGGLGARVALAAVGMGHEGIVISRLGQDEPARIVLEREASRHNSERTHSSQPPQPWTLPPPTPAAPLRTPRRWRTSTACCER